ncbi:MAG: hypothetical protein K6D02_06855, partial [Lachnospiraceae bacterium]|nr:hypothetical protein [Lachnospiraceae bacterium]
MITEAELKKLAEKHGLKLVKGMGDANSGIDTECSIEDYFDVCEKIVFYHYLIIDKNEWIITDEVQDEVFDFDAERDYCESYINEWNEDLDKLDFNRPMLLSLATIINGQIVRWDELDPWFHDYLEDHGYDHEEIENSYDLLNDFFKTVEEDIEIPEEELYDEKEEEIKKQNKELELELKKQLYADPKFRMASNKELRRSYARSFIEIKSNLKYKSLYFNKASQFWPDNDKMAILVDELYSEY